MKIDFLRKKAGFTMIELLLVATMVTSVPVGAYKAVGKAKEIVCHNNLDQISKALFMFEMENGRLPSASFYPKDPNDSRSIRNILMPYLRNESIFTCPCMPQPLAKKGLTYLWNDKCNGRVSGTVPGASKKWLMIEMTAVSDKVPPPHSGKYNILFVDGHIEKGDAPSELRTYSKSEIPRTRKTSFSLSGFPVSCKAGEKLTLTVKAIDAFGAPLISYSGRIGFSSNDKKAVLPEEYTFTQANNGRASFSKITFFTAGSQKLIVYDKSKSDMSTTYQVNIMPDSLDHFRLQPLSAQKVGVPFNMVVTAEDRYGNRITDFKGEINLYDLGGSISPTHLKGFISGIWEGKITITKSKTNDSLIVNDEANHWGTSIPFEIQPGEAKEFLITFPSPYLISGQKTNFILKIIDEYGNKAHSYQGNVKFSSSDWKAEVPKEYTFTSQDKGEWASSEKLIFFTSGKQTLIVTDSDNPQIKGSQIINVLPGPLHHFTFEPISSPKEAGIPFEVKITARDEYENLIDGLYLSGSSKEKSYFTPNLLSGTWEGKVTRFKSGETYLSIDDGCGHKGTSNRFEVNPGPVHHFIINGLSKPLRPKEETGFELKVVDAYGNTVPSYCGIIHFTSTDLKANLPSDYTFNPEDKGSRMFKGKTFFSTIGLHSLTAIDSEDDNLKGTKEGIIVRP